MSLLITNARIYDPDSRQFIAGELGIDNGLIAAPGDVTAASATHVIDAADGYLAPAFIDMHCHIFDHSLFRTSRLAADRIGVRQGVGCLIDTGSAGPTMIDGFREFVIDTQQTACFALCNIGSPGQPGIVGGHSATPELVSLQGTVDAITRHPDWILGVKVLASSTHTGLLGLEAVKIGRKAAELTGKPLMVHIGNAPPVIDDVLNLLRPGDIVTHAYHGKAGGVLGYQDKVIAPFRAAVERGVIVDIAHGRSSFSYRTCELALEQGMPIHTISSDLHRGNVDRYVVSLARTMSKFRALGLSLEEVVEAVSITPARVLGLLSHGFGSLAPGMPANLTLFEETDRAVDMEDAEGEIRPSCGWIEPKYCFRLDQCHEVSEPL